MQWNQHSFMMFTFYWNWWIFLINSNEKERNWMSTGGTKRERPNKKVRRTIVQKKRPKVNSNKRFQQLSKWAIMMPVNISLPNILTLRKAIAQRTVVRCVWPTPKHFSNMNIFWACVEREWSNLVQSKGYNIEHFMV